MQHDEFGTMGLVINRPSDLRVDGILPEVAELEGFDGKLYVGGPVAAYSVILLVRSPEAPEDAQHIFGDVYASGSRELLANILSDTNASSRIRIYAGHAGWSPGQLDGEIARGSWQVVPADENMVFAKEPADLWKKMAPPPRPIVVRAH
jgi:putative transcriptional regulator